MPKPVPLASHRHATPANPWPWMDLESEETNLPQRITPCDHRDCEICPKWLGYPQSHFPNWTPDQVMRCKIAPVVQDRQHPCRVFQVDVNNEEGTFAPCDGKGFLVTKETQREFWHSLQTSNRPQGLRARALFVENLSGPVLQILGASYNIEPFFFSSSLNWIPSRYQEDVRAEKGDHITITLTFLRTMPSPHVLPPSISRSSTNMANDASPARGANNIIPDEHYDLRLLANEAPTTEIIDTQAPLSLRSDDGENTLLLDVLDVHMIRDLETSTMVFYHPDPEWQMTSAMDLQGRARLIGESVYWQDVFRRSQDPTFLLVAVLWYALYAWDEALEVLYSHICFLEGKVIDNRDMLITHEFHIIRAHLLHYETLLEDFQKSVKFILNTPNPAMDWYRDGQKERDRQLLEKESNNLMVEIKRLQMSRGMQDMRVMNVMNLVFSIVNLNDSKRMQTMTEATVRDSEAMKQISYLTMVFLPASFVAGIFGMNVKEINPGTLASIPYYFATTIPLTLVTIWVIVAFQGKYYGSGSSMWTRFLWPIKAFRMMFSRGGASGERQHQILV